MSQVISYRLFTDEVLALRRQAMPGESDSQTAQRLMKELLGVIPSTPSTNDTLTLDERIKNAVNSSVDDRIQAFKREVIAALKFTLIEELWGRSKADFIEGVKILADEKISAKMAESQDFWKSAAGKGDELSYAIAQLNHAIAGLNQRVEAIEDSVEIPLEQPSTVLTDMSTSVEQPQPQEPPPTELGNNALARRLKVDGATLIKNRFKPNFAQWTRERDPDALAWQYDRELKLFFPIGHDQPENLHN